MPEAESCSSASSFTTLFFALNIGYFAGIWLIHGRPYEHAQLEGDKHTEKPQDKSPLTPKLMFMGSLVVNRTGLPLFGTPA